MFCNWQDYFSNIAENAFLGARRKPIDKNENMTKLERENLGFK